MFTGIVERTARVEKVSGGASGCRLLLAVEPHPALPPWKPVALGDSIALNGVCLSAVELENREGGGRVGFDVVPETLRRTNLGRLEPGDRVNLERSLAVGDTIGGHYVTGHVDGTGTVRSRAEEGDQVLFEVSTPPHLLRQVIVKGSVAVDGISLTVVGVDRREGWFSFAAIPHTLERTILDATRPGDVVNLETDAFGKWVLHGLEEMLREDPGAVRQLLERSGRPG